MRLKRLVPTQALPKHFVEGESSGVNFVRSAAFRKNSQEEPKKPGRPMKQGPLPGEGELFTKNHLVFLMAFNGKCLFLGNVWVEPESSSIYPEGIDAFRIFHTVSV